MNMEQTREYWALITGATSGIGAAYARSLAENGVNLVLTGRREQVLSALAERLESQHRIKTRIVIGDLADLSTVDAVIAAGKACGNLLFLINNAGYGAENGFFEDGYEQQEPMLKVHIDAAARITHALAPSVSVPKGTKGGVIFVSSVASFVSSPSSVFYCSTKAFLNSFATSIALSLYKKKVPVQALCPGFTRTDFHDKLHIPRARLKNKGIIRWMKADTLVRISLKHLKMRKIIVVPGFFNKLMVFIAKVTPNWLFMPIAVKQKKLFASDNAK